MVSVHDQNTKETAPYRFLDSIVTNTHKLTASPGDELSYYTVSNFSRTSSLFQKLSPEKAIPIKF